jgi:hypothetical protein
MHQGKQSEIIASIMFTEMARGAEVILPSLQDQSESKLVGQLPFR